MRETRELLVGMNEPESRVTALTAAARRALGSSLALAVDDETPVVLPEPPLTLRATLRRELEELADPASGAAIGDVLLHALEAILRGGPFDRVVVCFLTTDRLELVARTGLGTDVDALIPRFTFPLSVRGGPVVALTQQRQPVYLPTDRALAVAEQRWAAEFGITQFGVFPLVVLGKLIGCVYADRRESAAPPDRATVRYAKALADVVVDAIGRRRS
jgi:hypothetical protein